MSWPLIAASLWAIAATITALLPMRLQYAPGLTLLILAPFILIWLAATHSIWIAVLGLFGFLSMFRNPLIYFYRRARGESPEIPK